MNGDEEEGRRMLGDHLVVIIISLQCALAKRVTTVYKEPKTSEEEEKKEHLITNWSSRRTSYC